MYGSCVNSLRLVDYCYYPILSSCYPLMTASGVTMVWLTFLSLVREEEYWRSGPLCAFYCAI